MSMRCALVPTGTMELQTQKEQAAILLSDSSMYLYVDACIIVQVHLIQVFEGLLKTFLALDLSQTTQGKGWGRVCLRHL